MPRQRQSEDAPGNFARSIPKLAGFHRKFDFTPRPYGDILFQMRFQSGLAGKVFGPLLAAPLILQAYLLFAVAVTAFEVMMVFSRNDQLLSLLTPYTGWNLAMFYSFTVFFAFAIAYIPTRRNVMRFAVILQLLFSILAGNADLYQRSTDTFGNPYLIISPWRPVWTMALPAFWIVLFFTPGMNLFCRNPSGQDFVASLRRLGTNIKAVFRSELG
jgi:hypothetical protein